jgi:linoleoyl-CoA desaturase
MQQKVKFVNKDQTDFFKVLKERVSDYFAENQISQHANAKMIFKTVFMLALYFVPYALMITGIATGFYFWICWALIGFGLAGIGMSIMHDANHGAYSSNKRVNHIVGLILNIVGGDASNWKMQHNILHHTYTNVHGHDEDIQNRVGMRFSPSGQYKKSQRFQVFFAFGLYSLLTLFWCTTKDFIQYARYTKVGHFKETRSEKFKTISSMIIYKIIHLGYIIVLPIIILPLPWWHVMLGYLLMHVIGGLVLSIVFQLAHVVESTQFPVPNNEGNIENEWAIHQLQTTTDFSAKNPILTFYVGGLNFQAIHHLFPRICHIHYPKLRPIVEKTAQEYGVSYLYFPSFGKAFRSHVNMLKTLGRSEIVHLASEM